MENDNAIPLTKEQQDNLNDCIRRMTEHQEKADALKYAAESLTNHFLRKHNPINALLVEAQESLARYFEERHAERAAHVDSLRLLKQYNEERGVAFPDAWQKIIDDFDAGR